MDGYIYLPKDAGSVHDIQKVLILDLRERERSGYFIGVAMVMVVGKIRYLLLR